MSKRKYEYDFQFKLTREQYDALLVLSVNTGRTLSELVREGVDSVIRAPRPFVDPNQVELL